MRKTEKSFEKNQKIIKIKKLRKTNKIKEQENKKIGKVWESTSPSCKKDT